MQYYLTVKIASQSTRFLFGGGHDWVKLAKTPLLKMFVNFLDQNRFGGFVFVFQTPRMWQVVRWNVKNVRNGVGPIYDFDTK